MGYKDAAGNVVIEPAYDYAYSFAPNGRAMIVSGQKYGFIDEKGNIVAEPKYVYAEGFAANGLAVVGTMEEDKLEFHFGYIDKNGDYAIAPDFTSAESFDEDGFAWAADISGWSIIDENGNMAVTEE